MTHSSFFLFSGRTLKWRRQRETAARCSPPPVFHHLITATWQRDMADARQADETDMLISGKTIAPPLHFHLISVWFLLSTSEESCVFDRDEILCWVTYSVQFKVPLFLLPSAGIGSHRGAVQPLHCRGSDCRGRQREREMFHICILPPRPHQTDPGVRRRLPSTRSSSTV